MRPACGRYAARVDANDKHGLIDYTEKVLIPFQFDDLGRQSYFIKTVIFMNNAEKELCKQNKTEGEIRISYYAYNDLGCYDLGERRRMHNGIKQTRYACVPYGAKNCGHVVIMKSGFKARAAIASRCPVNMVGRKKVLIYRIYGLCVCRRSDYGFYNSR